MQPAPETTPSADEQGMFEWPARRAAQQPNRRKRKRQAESPSPPPSPEATDPRSGPLSTDVLACVFSFGRQDEAARWGVVSRVWRQASLHPSLWQRLSLRDSFVTRRSRVLADFSTYFGRDRLALLTSLTLRAPTESRYYSATKALRGMAGHCGRLRELCITGCGELSPSVFCDFVATTPGLEVLQAGSIDAPGTAPLHPARQLQHTGVENRMLAFSSPVLLTMMPLCRSLRVLDIAGWGVTDLGLRALLEEAACLEALSVEACYCLTSAFCASLPAARALEVLDVSLLIVTARDWGCLADALPPRLRVLIAASTRHNAAAVDRIRRHPPLQLLCVPPVGGRGLTLAASVDGDGGVAEATTCSTRTDAAFSEAFGYAARCTAPAAPSDRLPHGGPPPAKVRRATLGGVAAGAGAGLSR
eukprot:Rhum_TRINITY_DN14408_c3_g2::Rhum_TRINITY_DN14408_c3_g2_i1::g.88582::m.88582